MDIFLSPNSKINNILVHTRRTHQTFINFTFPFLFTSNHPDLLFNFVDNMCITLYVFQLEAMARSIPKQCASNNWVTMSLTFTTKNKRLSSLWNPYLLLCNKNTIIFPYFRDQFTRSASELLSPLRNYQRITLNLPHALSLLCLNM